MSDPIQVMVVEDDNLTQDVIAQALEGEGYQVLKLSDGRSALDLIHTSDRDPQIPAIDLIILDVMLPLLNGLDFCRLLRSQGNNIPVLMISAKTSEIDRVVGLEVGADDYLAKPFGLQELIARCRVLLRHRQYGALPNGALPTSETVLNWGDLTLYPDTYRVTLRGQEVALTPKEFRLLELFMRHPRQVWNREQLIERIWGQDFMGDSKTVDVHIRWLREKLEDDPGKPKYLITVRGFGYRLG